jgi:hypothetical protein
MKIEHRTATDSFGAAVNPLKLPAEMLIFSLAKK